MERYMISYDLREPPTEANYGDLIKTLENDGAKRILRTQWAIWSELPAAELFSRYRSHIQDNDRLLINVFPRHAMGRNLITRLDGLQTV